MVTKGKGKIRNTMHKIRSTTNFLIHGCKTVSPEEAKEKITSIKRFFDMAQVQASTGSPYQAMIGKKDP